MAILCLGGSFNPIHHGHLICGRAAAEIAGYQQVALIPSNHPPHKGGDLAPADARHRAAMCRLAVAGSDLFTVDERELSRPGPSYTIDTAQSLLDSGWDHVDWLIGSDSLPALATWHRAEELVELVTFKVMLRPGAKVDWKSLPAVYRQLEKQVILTPRIDISATDIRARLATGRSIEYLVPPVVAAYIRDHGLYRGAGVMNFYDVAYSVGLGISAPIWVWIPTARRKIRRARAERWGDVPTATSDSPGILLHAVSVGELNATPTLVKRLADHRPDVRFCITTTTDTGIVRARELYGNDPRITPARFPVDFSTPVNCLLVRQRPAVAVLMELEVWPNFMLSCHRRNIPVVVINGRITTTSFRGYQRTAKLTGRMFKRLAMVCVQDQTYADRFIALGVPPERVKVTGTMKFDTATVAEQVDGAAELAAAVGLRQGAGQEPIWVCGSTGPGEETLILSAYAELRKTHPALRLAVIPRHPQRFDEVATMIESAGYPLIRRSASSVAGGVDPGLPASATPATERPGSTPPATSADPPAIILGDTMGELRKFYSLAAVVFVGRSLVDLGPRQHGSDMIEPAALAKPVIVGRYTGNFAEVMNRFQEADAILPIAGVGKLAGAVDFILTQPNLQMGTRAQQVVRDNQGATEANAEVISHFLK